MNFTLVELQRIKLEPDEILTVKLYGDDYEPESVDSLQEQLKSLFPNNRVMMFVLPNGNDLQFEAISGTLVDNENKDLEQREETLEKNLEIISELNKTET